VIDTGRFAHCALQDRTALVTGAGRGIGRGIALALARGGAKVALVSRTEGDLEHVAEQARELGGVALVIPADVSRAVDVEQVTRTVIDTFGRLDVLVNCAGVLRRAAVEDLSEDNWDLMMDVNLKCYFLMSRAALPIMAGGGGGYVFNVAANVLTRPKLLPNLEGYYATKAGIVGLSRSLMTSAEARNVRVSVIMPGTVYKPGAGERDLDYQIEIDDVASLIVYLASTPPHVHIREVVITGRKF
jgi:NAD(P)-dependent dehydrogenase (short-subunit alcohol dehydrogenase family)